VRPGAPTLLAAGALLVGAAGAPGEVPPDASRGERVYRDHCAICHGEAGDGRGLAAHHFRIPPRDFTKGRYKIRSTVSGQPPTDDDLRRSIVGGLPGTGMVPQDHVSEAEVEAVIAYIKRLSPRFAENAPRRLLQIPPEPPVVADALARGRKAYDRGECAECHGREGRGDGPSAKDLSLKPADLTRRPFKGGSTARDTVRTLLTGFEGTPMPSYHGVLDDDELWYLGYWLDSIGGPPEPTDDERAGWQVVRHHQRRGR
jgi:mono/diheme cytochrome c family protein